MSSEQQEHYAINFRDDVTVELVKANASDSDVVWAARVSTAGENSLDDVDADPTRSAGLINYLARERHGSPFEHTSMTFFISAPIFVFREFMRHRIASYNEESGRYRELRPNFYIPSKERKLVQIGKAGSYTFIDGSDEQYVITVNAIKESCILAYENYKKMLDAGVAREVARAVLPVGLYSTMYVTMNSITSYITRGITFSKLSATRNRDGSRENGAIFCDSHANYARGISKVWTSSPLVAIGLCLCPARMNRRPRFRRLLDA
jgi:thymidylate synthase (FAD)